jgi:hypothetical protein
MNGKWKPLGKQTAGRPNDRWEGEFRRDMTLLEIKNWTK